MLIRSVLLTCAVAFWAALSASAVDSADPDRKRRLGERYVPYADWTSSFAPGARANVRTPEVWWQTPGEIRASRKNGEPPLSGLHVALDPGHIGGDYAEGEGRHFRIRESDFFAREGELALVVAGEIRSRLEALGAQVTLLRESNRPVVVARPKKRLREIACKLPPPDKISVESLADYAIRLRQAYFHETYVKGELLARAEKINRSIRPDVVLSVHINAAPWPEGAASGVNLELVEGNHSHVLVFGCMTAGELSSEKQVRRLQIKMANGSGIIEEQLGAELAPTLGDAFSLPPSNYQGKNAVRLNSGSGYLWARNLLLLRQVDCPVLLMEPFLANSIEGYRQLQEALHLRHGASGVFGEQDILSRYAEAVVASILRVYGPAADAI